MMLNNRTDDELLTEVDAAKILSLSTRTLQAWRIKAVGPPFVRAGRAVRYRRSDISAWVQANIVPTHWPSKTVTAGGAV